MSLAKHLLNPWLRLTEKTHLARATPEKMRRALELKARLFFWPPRGAVFKETTLSHKGQQVGALDVQACETPDGPLMLYFHGGGYVFGSPRTHRAMLAWLSRFTGLSACLPRYRLAPEHVFPSPIEDALTAYQAVMAHPGGVVLGGDSAGGGLALALLGEITRLGLPQPVGTFVFSPLTDQSFSGDSIRTNARAEVVLPTNRIDEMTQIFLAGVDPTDPRASPLFAEFKGASPVWLAVGDTEILLDDTLRMAEHLTAQGVDVTCIVEPNLPHVWPIFKGLLPEADHTLRALARWITALSPPTSDS